MNDDLSFDHGGYQRTLGDEIRRRRKHHGWTRKELNERIPTGRSLQTLATYELGTRSVSVVHFVEICRALDEVPHQLLERVDSRFFADAPATGIIVDLREVAVSRQDALLPMRRWAAKLLNDDHGREMHLDMPALISMAQLCDGLTPDELIERLGRIPGSVVVSRSATPTPPR